MKEILFNEKARKKIVDGVNIVADAVTSTLGPKGNNVIFEESTYPTITKDGVTVAQQISLEDKFENMGAMMAREAAENTNREAGDGTTSTVALLRAIVNEGNKYITAGMNPILLKRGMDIALKDVLGEIDKQVRKIKTDEEKLSIATISTNNDTELGKLIAEVIEKTGVNGVVTVTTSSSLKTEVEYVQGTKLDRGYASHYFINNGKRLQAEMENPAIIITTDKVVMQSQLVDIIQDLLRVGKRNILLLADKIEGQALAFLTQNHLLGKFTCIPVELPSFGHYQRDIVKDIATLTGAIVLGEEEAKRLSDGRVEDTGTCENVIVGMRHTILQGADGDVSENIEEVKALLKEEKDLFNKEKLKERLGKLTGSIANIKVGGASETDQTEIRYRIEDALNATKSAIEDGIVEGAGIALLKVGVALSPEKIIGKEQVAGYDIVKDALRAPSKKILENAGLSADAILAKIIELDKGYNVLTDEYANLHEIGIIDPARCVKQEIINAVATAGIILTASVAIARVEEKK